MYIINTTILKIGMASRKEIRSSLPRQTSFSSKQHCIITYQDTSQITILLMGDFTF